ncbi:MAG: hypothetical protein WDM80_05915 [Limisphaerales bacterium]
MDKNRSHFPLIQHLWDTCVQNSHPAPDRKKISTTTILSRQPILRIHALKIATCFYGLPGLKLTPRKSVND